MGTNIVSEQNVNTHNAELRPGFPIARGNILPGVRVNGSRLTLENTDIFCENKDELARRLLDVAFSVPEVGSVVLRWSQARVDIELSPAADATRTWRRLGLLLRQGGAVSGANHPKPVEALNLRPLVPDLPVRVSRVGASLTTFRVRPLSPSRVRISHPLLRRRDVLYRLRETIISAEGVLDVRAVALWASVIITYDPLQVDGEALARLLDRSWPQVIEGYTPPPFPKKLVVAGGLLSLASYAQLVNLGLLPLATAAVFAYSLPNLIAALRDLSRGRVGLPALYSAGLGFLLWTGLPFAASVMAVLFQGWPALAQSLAVDCERRLFAEHRRRLVWARIRDGESVEIAVDADRVAPGVVVSVRAGEYVPVDGVVVVGLASLREGHLTGMRGVTDRSLGDTVYAGSLVLAGRIDVRTIRAGQDTVSAAVARALPHGVLTGLPSSAGAERIANRNARPALLLAGLALLVTRTPRLSQVIIRPDYATAPRLSAHLSALTALSDSLAAGALVRNPAAFDRLAGADIFVFDDDIDYASRDFRIAELLADSGVEARRTLAYAAAALDGQNDPRSRAVLGEAERRNLSVPRIYRRQRLAGAIRFRSDDGDFVTVATPACLLQAGFKQIPGGPGRLLDANAAKGEAESGVPPLIVARGRTVVGAVTFARTGTSRIAAAVTGLRRWNPEARFVHLSRSPQDGAEDRVAGLGFDAVFAGLDPQDKAEAIRNLSHRAVWLGDGARRESAQARAASAVSVSLGRLPSLARDEADVVMLHGDPEALLPVLAAARNHDGRLKADYRAVYLANLAAIAGGLVAGFGGLQAGLTSNLGTAVVFLSRLRALRKSVTAAAAAAAGHDPSLDVAREMISFPPL